MALGAHRLRMRGFGRDLALAVRRLDAELPEAGARGKADKAGPVNARRGWVAAGG